MDLEGEVRKFVADWEEKERKAEQDGLPADPDSEDDEIVFVGRNGQMNDLRSPTEAEAIKKELMLFETPEEDVGGSFGRWLVHHIGVYYGLKTWSVTVGNPARREGLAQSRCCQRQAHREGREAQGRKQRQPGLQLFAATTLWLGLVLRGLELVSRPLASSTFACSVCFTHVYGLTRVYTRTASAYRRMGCYH